MKKKIISVVIAAAITVGLALSAFMLAFAGSDPIQVWNVRDEVSKGVTAAANSGTNLVGTKVSDIDCGDMSLIVKHYYYIKELTATKITVTEQSSGTSGGCNHGFLQFTETGIKTHLDYSNAHGVKFIAPKSGIYNIVPTENLVVENTQSASYFTVTAAGKPLAIGPDGETSIDVASGLLTSGAKSTVSLKEVSVKLDAGDALEINCNAKGGYSTYFTYDFDIEFMEDLTPLNSWSLRNNISSSLAALAASGENKNGTPISDLDFGDFSLRANYYSKVDSITATQINNNGCAHGYLKITDTGVQMHQDYKNEWGIKFTAPKTGVYRFAPKGVDGVNSVSFGNPTDATYFKVTHNGDLVAIGPNGETEVSTANGLLTSGVSKNGVELKEFTVVLQEEDIVEFFGIAGSSWNNTTTFNYYIEFIEDQTPSDPLVSYDMAADMRKNLAALDYNGVGNGYNYEVINENMLDYNFGAFNLVSIRDSAKTIGEVEKKGSEYIVYSNLKNTGKEGYQKDYYANPSIYVSEEGGYYDGIGLWAKHYATAFEYVFTAPSEGVYRISNKSAYKGIPESVYNTYPNDISFSVYVNGVAQNIGSGADKTVITLKNKEYSDIGGMDEIKLAKGDTISFRFLTTLLPDKDGKADWGAGTIYINLTVDATELGNNLETAHTTFNVGDEMRKTFANSTELDAVIEDNKFGPFTFTLKYRNDSETAKFQDANAVQDAGCWSAKTSVYPNPRIITGLTDSLYPGYALKKQGYGNHKLITTFTAPADGTYRFVPQDCYQGKIGSVYNNYSANAIITVEINGVKQGNDLVVPAKATADLKRIDNIKLDKGDTITVTINTEAPATIDWSWYNTYVNYDIDLVTTADENFYYAGIELSDNIVKAGNETYVDLGLTNLMENVSGFSAKIKFDKNLFEFVRAENLSVTAEDFQVADNGAGEVGVVYVSDKNDIGNNSTVRLYFKVKAGVTPSTFTISPTEAMFVRIDAKDKTKVEEVNFTNFITDDAVLKVR